MSIGHITVGDLSSLMLYTAYVGSALVGLTSFCAQPPACARLMSADSTVMKGLGAASRVFELVDAKPIAVELGVGRKLLASEPAQKLRFDNLVFAYPSRPGAPILQGVSFSVEPGSSVAVRHPCASS